MSALDELRDARIGALEEAEKAALKLERSYRRLASRKEVTMSSASEYRAQARAVHSVVREIRKLREG